MKSDRTLKALKAFQRAGDAARRLGRLLNMIDEDLMYGDHPLDQRTADLLNCLLAEVIAGVADITMALYGEERT